MLLTNGCSFVWGDELIGYDDDPPSHKHHTFTHKLAELLGCEYVNLGTCGAGNAKIFRDTIHYLRDPKNPKPTHIVILWSAWQRGEVAENHPESFDVQRNIQRWQCMTQISPARVHNLKKELRDPLDRMYDHYDATRTGIIQTLSYMEAMEMLCDSLGIKLIQGIFHQLAYQNFLDSIHRRYRKNHWSPWVDWVMDTHANLKKTSKIGLGFYQDMFSMAEEKYTVRPFGHPDEDTHTEYAQLLHHIFNTQFDESEE